MTLLKEKMQAAGVDTSQARLAALAVVALQKNGANLNAALDRFFQDLLSDPGVLKEALLRPYLMDRQRDMRGPGGGPFVSIMTTSGPRRQPSRARQQAIAKIVEKAVEVILFKHHTSDGRDWATVGAHELTGMDRDGKLARAIKDRLGALSNAQQVKPIGELMTRAIFNEVRTSLEAQP